MVSAALQTSEAELFRLLNDRASYWAASLTALREDTAAISARTGPQTLFLPTQASASPLTAGDSSTPASSSPKPDGPMYITSKPHSPPRVQSTPAQKKNSIHYNGQMQAMIADVTMDVERAIELARQSSRRQEITDIGKDLATAADLCHKAALQLLRNGKIDSSISSATEIFRHLHRNARERETREKWSVQHETIGPPTTSAEAPRRLTSNLDIESSDLEAPISDNASDMLDLVLDNVRLTSRMR